MLFKITLRTFLPGTDRHQHKRTLTMYKHILFATDLTEDTEYLLHKVRTIQNTTNAKLSLIHVVEPLPGYSYAYLGIEDIEGQLIEEARKSIEKLGTELNVDKAAQFVE